MILKMSNFIIFLTSFFYLIKLPVVFLNGGSVFHPDFQPETLVLTELSQFSRSLGVGGVTLTVLQFPGLALAENISVIKNILDSKNI